MTSTAQRQPHHRRFDMHVIDYEAIPHARAFQSCGNRSWLSALEWPHSVEQMSEAGKTGGYSGKSLLVCRHRMSKGHSRARRNKFGDKFEWNLLRRQCDDCSTSTRRGDESEISGGRMPDGTRVMNTDPARR